MRDPIKTQIEDWLTLWGWRNFRGDLWSDDNGTITSYKTAFFWELEIQNARLAQAEFLIKAFTESGGFGCPLCGSDDACKPDCLLEKFNAD